MRRIPPAWRLAFILWLALRLVNWAFGAALFASGFAPLHSGYNYGIQTLTEGLDGALRGIWMRWDGVYYDLILTQGYQAMPNLSAFFPLFPLLARPLTALGLHAIPALITVSSLALLPALALFLQEVERLLGAQAMLPAGLGLMLFPTAFYFYAPYPQSLALLLILLAWRLARSRRWLGCALAGLLAGLAHSTVAPLVILLLVEAVGWLRSTRARLGWAALAVPFMPLAGVALFLAWRIGQGFPAYGDMQRTFFGTTFIGPWQGLLEVGRLWQNGNYRTLLATLLCLALAVLATAWALRARRFALAAYLGALVLLLLSVTMPDAPLASFNRYLLLGFPLFLALGDWMTRSPRLKLGLLAVFGVFYAVLCAYYLSWVWVA